MRITILILMVFVFINLNGQPLKPDYIEYFDYNTVIKDLKSNGIKSAFYSNLDYESMLYLDKSAVKTLLKVNPKFLKEKNIDTTVIFQKINNQLNLQFDLSSNNLRDFFDNKVILNKALNKLVGEGNRNLDNQIYIKNNQIAIFTVWGHSWSSTYKAILIDNKVKIELLYQINE